MVKTTFPSPARCDVVDENRLPPVGIIKIKKGAYMPSIRVLNSLTALTGIVTRFFKDHAQKLTRGSDGFP
ncbi:protein of unknown function [Xenorhabdus poinarii G6]|uniref:Uncharacterized protein n=1 Tax=Xenorhabdus poinarii G6 TaxID=1354304 RepID=A0A068QYW7_9GAMM|nr:protein of unknown function [Xenorhabdus poinarii G6]